ncbi:hypothetical protein ACU8KH_01326 [Lachancea thermotolerans]
MSPNLVSRKFLVVIFASYNLIKALPPLPLLMLALAGETQDIRNPILINQLIDNRISRCSIS